MKKGEATGPQKKKSMAADPVPQEQEVDRRDQLAGRRRAYAATTTRMASIAEELAEAAAGFPPPEDVNEFPDSRLSALHDAERQLADLCVRVSQLRDTM